MTPAARPRRITVVTSGHLSTCPRMLKAADALTAAGHAVRMVATCHEPWAAATDALVRSRRPWPVVAIDYRRGQSGSTYWRSGIRYRAARALASRAGARGIPWSAAVRAFGRVHPELADAASSTPADFIYGGTTGALAAVREAARRLRVPYGIDFEDLHSAETLGPDAAVTDALAARIEEAVARYAVFVTVSSEAIGGAYRQRYGLEPVTIHNTFPLPSSPPSFTRADPSLLRLYWFSQTIGEGRGLEAAIEAAGRPPLRVEMTLRGRPKPGYLERLQALAARQPSPVRIVHEPPADPDAMVDLARGYDVGLATELGAPLNHQLCASNKAFTYVLAGIAVVASDLPGIRPIALDFNEGAAIVPAGDVDALSAALMRWAREPARLDCARRAAWAAARRRWHYGHPLEGGRLCALVREALS